jgi:hypothetical protein
MMPYVNRLRGLIKSCRYEHFADEFLHDRIVLSICDLNLVYVINQLKASDIAQLQLQQITTDT